jgi:hypothetical protein
MKILSDRVKKYFKGIHPMVKSTSPLILSWVNSRSR